MPEYKKQHYVFASYLKEFAIDGNIQGRDTRIYVTEGTRCFSQKVANVAKRDYTYSKTAAEDAEQWFQHMESEYSPDLALARANPLDVPVRQQLALLLTIFDLHYRNARYEIPASLERIDVYKHWSAESLTTEILGQPQPENMQVLTDLVAQQWKTVILNSDEDLVTSDNPSMLFNDGESTRVTHCLLPVSPSELLVSYRSDCIDLLSASLTSADAGLINGIVSSQSIGQVYSSRDWEPNDLARTAELREKHGKPHLMNMQNMTSPFMKIDKPLSFIERKPN